MNPAPSASSDIGPQVNPVLGSLVLADEPDLDFVLEGPMDLAWQRIYHSQSTTTGWLGAGWRTPLEVSLARRSDAGAVGELVCVDLFGRALSLPVLKPGATHVLTGDQITLRRAEDGGYSVSTTEGITYHFGPREASHYPLQAISDRQGNTTRLQWRRGAGSHVVCRVEASGGQVLALHLEGGRLRQIDRLRPEADRWVPERLCRYELDAQGRLTRVFNRADECMRAFQYDAQGLLCREQYAATFEAWYEHALQDGVWRVVRHGDNTGQSWQLAYGATETKVTDQDARVWVFHLDAQRRWTGLTDPLGQLTRYGLDRAGRLRAIIDPLEHVTEMRYDEQGNKVEVRDPCGGVTRIAWHPELGLPTAIEDPLGRTTSFDYDERGNLIAEVEADGATTLYEVDARGLPVCITDAKGGKHLLRYNEAAQVVSHVDCSGRETRYAYDQHDLLVSETDALGQTTRYEYDAAGRLVSVVSPDGAVERYEVDLAQRPVCIVDALGHRTQFRYAPDGLLTERTDALGQKLMLHYTGSRQLARIVNENGASFAFHYDVLDRLISEIQFDGKRVDYAYDAGGRIVGTVESAGTAQAIVTRYRRDPVGRLLERSTPTTTTLMRYDAAGQLVEARNKQVRVAFEYDDVGQLRAEEVQTSLGHDVIRHVYDEMGNRLQTVLPGGLAVQRLYYGSAHLHHVALTGRTVLDVDRDALHREVSRTQGRLTVSRRHDAGSRIRAWVASRADQDDAAPLAALGLEVDYDAAGRPHLMRAASGEIRFEHDALDRLTLHGGERFHHDPAHNLQMGGAAVVRDNRVQQSGAIQYVHDAHGRVVERRRSDGQRLQLVWDDEHRLVRSILHDRGEVRETAYLYDPFGRRLAKACDRQVTRFFWEEDRLLAADDGRQRQVYFFDQDSHEPMAVATCSAQQPDADTSVLHYFHCDQAGVPYALTDGEGQIVWRGRMNAWGRLDEEAGSVVQPLRHQGQWHDHETGLHYNGHRYYDPETGRFLSKDPIGLAGGLNEYQYVFSPLFWIDPTGLTGTYIMSGGVTKNYVGKGPKARSQASKRARMVGCPKVAIQHHDYKDDEMGFMVEYLLMKHYNARKSPNWANSSKLNSPGKKKYAAASKARKAQARAKAKKLREAFEKEKKACGL
jgi:RHS repeat-associated protein